MRNKIFANARPGVLPVPGNREIQSFAPPQVLERWADTAAGVRALAMGDNVITMFDTIGEDYWSDGGGVTARKVAAQLRAIGDRPIEVHINSFGGDMFEGIAIYNILREHPQDITVKVMGLAASAASIIAMAGDDIQIGSTSFLMIHNCWVGASGNQFQLREIADSLMPFDAAMADLYAERSGQKAADMAAMMKSETWISGSQAVEMGFASKILSSRELTTDEKAQSQDRELNELRAMELTLVQSGMTRSAARARIKKLKGTPGAASDAVTPGADETAKFLADIVSFAKSITNGKV